MKKFAQNLMYWKRLGLSWRQSWRMAGKTI